jgi:hypothetical protein
MLESSYLRIYYHASEYHSTGHTKVSIAAIKNIWSADFRKKSGSCVARPQVDELFPALYSARCHLIQHSQMYEMRDSSNYIPVAKG